MAVIRAPSLFLIFYNTLFTLLSLILVALLLIPPSDAIRQALSNRQLYNVFVIAALYFITGLLTILFYASRLYTTRAILASIPKPYLPITKTDLPPRVHALIKDALRRSALIAWSARPHIPTTNNTTTAVDADVGLGLGLSLSLPQPTKSTTTTTNPRATESTARRIARRTHHILRRHHRRRLAAANAANAALLLPCPDTDPVWGPITHPGWSSPTSPDLPNLHYAPVVAELPNLVEAKAVSLCGSGSGAAADAKGDSDSSSVVALAELVRPGSEGLREYVLRLLGLGVLAEETPWAEFVEGYEYARFSGAALSEAEFRALMGLFAEVLRGVRRVGGGGGGEEDESESDEDYEDEDEVGDEEEGSLRSQASRVEEKDPRYDSGGYDNASRSRSRSRYVDDDDDGDRLQTQISGASTPRGSRSRIDATSPSPSPAASWASLSTGSGSFASGDSVVRYHGGSDVGDG